MPASGFALRHKSDIGALTNQAWKFVHTVHFNALIASDLIHGQQFSFLVGTPLKIEAVEAVLDCVDLFAPRRGHSLFEGPLESPSIGCPLFNAIKDANGRASVLSTEDLGLGLASDPGLGAHIVSP